MGMKYKSTRQNLNNHLHGVDSTEYVPGKKERFSSISVCTIQERFCFRKDKSGKNTKKHGHYPIQYKDAQYDIQKKKKKKKKKMIMMRTMMMMIMMMMVMTTKMMLVMVMVVMVMMTMMVVVVTMMMMMMI